MHDPGWIFVKVLTELRWFFRGWVAQEAVLGRDARIPSSGFGISFLNLVRAHAWLSWRVLRLAHQPRHSNWKPSPLLEQRAGHQRRAEAKTLKPSKGYTENFTAFDNLYYAKE